MSPPLQSSPPHAARQSGFTLIEVMIAIVIMALISLIAWRGLESISRANTTLQLRSEENARLVRTLQQIERDISWRTTIELPSASTDIPPQGKEAEASNPPKTGGRLGQQPQLQALLPVGMEVRRGHPATFFIELVRAAPAAPGRWQRVQWWLQGSTLYRAAGETAAQYPIPAPRSADRVAVLEGVDFFAIQAWEPDRGWRSLPASAQARASASGLEVTLRLAHGGGPAWRYRKVIALR
ncbi:prepilin-type N-terminal cleavage/methylation domain-containing protein [Comamonas sp. GB3 AK4-5]|uniref:prepilin-type N-terminal cleavage/methylation domain-containing protein n=1 Tax=Comamonas sp. GB3 AK4-5 TaxID=3231487 RepID=UPI00351DD30B